MTTRPCRIVLRRSSGGRFKAFNFGIHGYGPRQMLAILENELEKPTPGARLPRYAIYQALSNHVSRCTGQSTPADIDLYVGIVKKSADIFHQRYGGEFYVVLWPGWPGDEGRSAQMFAKLSAKQIRVIKIEDLLPDYKPGEGKYRIPTDPHPSPLAYEKIAEGLVKLF